jgi:radical SAM protein with 4Fe4S-binding SPASM domain
VDGTLIPIQRRLTRVAGRERNQWAYNRQRIDPPARPTVFQVELTNHCPMRCEMCPRTHRMSRPLGYMSREVYERVIDQAMRSTSKLFLHHFGDSLVHPDIGEYIRYARSRGIGTYLSANPILLTPPRVEALVESGLDELVLSLDGVTSETSALVRGKAAANVELAEKRVRELLDHRRRAGSKKPFVIMQIVRQRQNLHEVDAWLRKWRAVEGVDRVKVKSYITWDGRDEAIERLRPSPRREREPVVCDKPWTSVTVLWDGTVVPCCFDFDGLLALGDLAREALDEIWHGERAKALRRAHRDGDLSRVTLCAQCKDKEGYPVRKWYYPANRLLQRSRPLDDEWDGRGDDPAGDCGSCG